MQSLKNFDRQYRLSAGQSGASGFEVGDGDTPLHINFSIQKSDLDTQNTGKVTVWNLNPQHLAVLNEKDCVLSLKAGYGNRLSLIFAGIVSFVSTEDDGTDQKTEIEVVDNLVEIRDTYVSVSYQGAVNWKTIFDDIANQMGVAISYSYNAAFVDTQNGYSYVGLAKNILKKGCDCCGLSWSLQNGVLQVKKNGDVMSKEVYVLNQDTGLIGYPKRVTIEDSTSEGKKQYGWDVTYFMNAAIQIDDFVKLESKKVTGYFRVYSTEIGGDNISGDWTCTSRLLEVKA